MLVVFAKKHPRALLESHASALRVKNSSTSWHGACGFSAAESMASMVSETGCVQLKMVRYAYIMLLSPEGTSEIWPGTIYGTQLGCGPCHVAKQMGDRWIWVIWAPDAKGVPERGVEEQPLAACQTKGAWFGPKNGWVWYKPKFGTKKNSPFGAYIVVHNTHCEDMLLSPRTQLKTCSWFIRVMQRSEGKSTIEKQTVRSTYHMQLSYNVGVCDHVYVYKNTDI